MSSFIPEISEMRGHWTLEARNRRLPRLSFGGGARWPFEWLRRPPRYCALATTSGHTRGRRVRESGGGRDRRSLFSAIRQERRCRHNERRTQDIRDRQGLAPRRRGRWPPRRI